MKREQLKGILRFWASVLLMLLQTGIFAFTLYNFYWKHIAMHYVRGNYVFIGLYALMMLSLLRLYGGFKIGQVKVQELLYSQILTVLCVNAVAYLQMCLIGRWLFLTNLPTS